MEIGANVVSAIKQVSFFGKMWKNWKDFKDKIR